MKQFFLLMISLFFVASLYSMRVRKWELEGTILIQLVEEIDGTYTDICVQKKEGEKEEAMYTGYKLVFVYGQEGREWELKGEEAKNEWDTLNNKYILNIIKK